MPGKSPLDFMFGDFESEGASYEKDVEANGDDAGWEGRRRRRHRRPGQQQQQPYGAQPYGAPSYGTPATSTAWPPPAPTTLPPGAPWPPPGASPGSDLSSYYAPGTAPISALPTGAAPSYAAQQPYSYASPYSPYSSYQPYQPQPLPNGQMPMMPGTNMPYPSPTIDVTVGGRGGVGLKFDAMGRATIVDLPRRRRR